MNTIDLLAQTRRTLEAACRSLDPADLTKIPAGHNNHALWQVGHLVVTQQLLCYRFSGLPMHVDDDFVRLFAKGSDPRQWTADDPVPPFETLIEQLHGLAAKLRTDYDAGLFQEFRTYTTSAGVILDSVDDAIRFNNFHEGVHLGCILCLRRALAAGL